jgi:hypothetical protein
MNAPAAVTLRRQGAPDLLVAYAAVVAELPVNPDARRIRRNAARRLLEMHPQLTAWMSRPTPARLADIKRTGAWPFLAWCFAEGHLVPDLDLLLAKDPGDLYRQWRVRNPGDVQLITEVAQQFGWSANWTRDVSRGRARPDLPDRGQNLASAQRRGLRRVRPRPGGGTQRRPPQLGAQLRPSVQPAPGLL